MIQFGHVRSCRTISWHVSLMDVVALLVKRPSTEKATWTTKFEFCPCQCFWIAKVFQHSQWQLTWSCTDQNHILAKKKLTPPSLTLQQGQEGMETDPMPWCSDCTNLANGIRTFRHWVSPDKKPCCLSLKLIAWETYCLKCLWYLLFFFCGSKT